MEKLICNSRRGGAKTCSFAHAVVLALAGAAGAAFAGENLIKNGTFEGTATQANWGAYATAANISSGKFRCDNWTFYNSSDGGVTKTESTAGLGKAASTWTAMTAAQVGTYALFVQSSTGSGSSVNAYVEQGLGVLTVGVYRVTFTYAVRNKDNPVTTYIELVDQDGHVISVGSVKTTTTSAQSFSKDLVIPSGTYTFRLRQPGVSKDSSNIFEGISIVRFDDDLNGAMRGAVPGDVIFFDTDGAGNATLSGTNIVWSGHMPSATVPGTLTISGANTIAAYASAPGTYTLFTAGSIVTEAGATLALDTPVTDGLVRTLTVGVNSVTLTIALDPARTEMVINNDFDIPGTSAGTVATTAPSWSYSYPRGGFCIPWWNFYCTPDGGSGCGLSQANGTWLATGQTNGGTYSLYGQGYLADTPMVRQDFGATPAGVYRFSFNCATRPSYANASWRAGIRKNGTVVHTIYTGPRGNHLFEKWDAVVALPAADAYGLQFLHFDGDNEAGNSSKSAVIDDVSFLRTAVAGWSVADGVTTLAGAAEVPPGSFIDGNAAFAAGAELSVSGNLYVPTLTVAGTLTVKGAVTVTLPAAYDTTEGTYTLIEAGTLAFDEGASLAINPAQADIQDGEAVRHAVLEISGNSVVLRMFRDNPVANNYRKSAAECVDTLFTTAANWSREHAPTTGDQYVIFNHPGTVTFDGAYANDAGLTYLFRNGLQAPVVFDATDDAYGFDFKGNYLFMGAGGGTGFTGWTEFRRGTYAGTYFCLNGTDGSGPNGKFRIDFAGATVNIVNCLQCGFAANTENEVNVSGGLVSMGAAYNTNIKPRTKNRTRVTGGKFDLRENLHACAGTNSELDFEITGGEMEVVGRIYADAKIGSFADVRLSGGVIRTDAISLPAGYGRFLFNGGALAPRAVSTAWHDGSTAFTVAAGKSAIVDTEGKDVTWSATVADVSGGQAYGFVKRGAGTLTFPAAQTFTGAISVEGGTILAPVAVAASSISVANGATYSVADGTAGQAYAFAALAPAGGGRIAIDVTASECDSLSATAIDLSGASAADPVVIVVNPIGIAELPATANYTLIASGLSAGDEAKFAVAGVDATLAVVNGALVMRSANRAKVTAEWSGAANDGGKWTTGGNWTGGEAPQNGDTAAFNLAAGGATDFDIAGLALGGLVFGDTAGAFTHGGAEQLRVANALTNASANVQTFTAPVALGVSGQPFELNTAGDTVFTGVTSIAASTLTKKGAGTLAVPGPTVLTAQRIEVDAGTLRIDERAVTTDAPVDGDIVVKDGARLDLHVASTARDIQKNELTRSKTIHVAGSGPDGAGALYNSILSAPGGSSHISRLVLTGDTKAGGGNVTVRGAMSASDSAYPDASITGPYTLTVANAGPTTADDIFFIANSAINVAGINLTGGMQLEGTLTGTVANGVKLSNGSSLRLREAVVPEGIPLSVDAGATVDVNSANGATTVNGSLKIGAGATVNVTPNSPITFNGAVTNAGTFVQAKSNNIYFDCPELVGGTYEVRGNHFWFGGAIDSPESEITLKSANAGITIFGAQSTLPGTGIPKLKAIHVDGTLAEIRFMPRAACEVTNNLYDAVWAAANKVMIDSVEDTAATVTVKNATWAPKGDVMLGSISGRGAYVKIADGATLTIPSGKGLYTAYNINSPKECILEVAEGGTLNYPGANNYFQIGRGSTGVDANALPQRLLISGGTVNMPTAQLLIGAYTRTAYADLTAGLLAVQQLQPRQTATYIANWKSAYDVRFTQTGGVLELGSGGSVSAIPGVDKPYLDLAAGTLRASENLSNRYGYMNIQFGASPTAHGEYTLDLNGKTVTWNAPLAGMSDVTITGEGTFTSAATLQSIPLGKWTVTNTMAVADLSGAAGFAGGLTVAPGKSAKIAVTGEGLVEWAFFNNNQIADMNALKAYTGVCPYVNSTLGHVHLSFGSNVAPMGTNSRFVYRGQFYVEADKAGTWYFGVNYDDNITLVIDGVEVASATAYNIVGTGSAELAEGWHDFRICVLDGSGSCGPYVSGWSNTMGVGWSTDAAAEGSTAASAYTKFDTTTLAMRLPQGAAAQTAVRMKAAPVSDGNTFMEERQPFTVLDCVTNSLALLHTLNGDGVASVANSQTVHYEGCFLVPEENAGEWTFTGWYDDYLSLYIDGANIIPKVNKTTSKTVQLTAGWHTFRIAVVDGVGNYGGKLKDDAGKVCALMAKAANATKTLAFDGSNFRLAYSAADAQKMCAAGLGGVIDVGAGATLQNDVAAGYCPIYGTLKGSGTLSGAFRFTGTTNCWAVTQSSVRELARVEFANPTKETFTGLKSLNATFNDKPTKALYYLSTATVDGLTQADLVGTTVTVTDGERDYSANFTLTVKAGRLALANSKPSGTYIIVR